MFVLSFFFSRYNSNVLLVDDLEDHANLPILKERHAQNWHAGFNVDVLIEGTVVVEVLDGEHLLVQDGETHQTRRGREPFWFVTLIDSIEFITLHQEDP